jgi:hypothetical protein
MVNPHDPVNINGNWWHYDATTRTHRPASDRPADRPADVERAAGNEPIRAGKGPAFGSRCSITIVSYRTRLCDADGISAKAAIDGLTHCGVLQDDSPKEVSEVSYRQVKVKNASDEKTEIIIERVK